MVMVSVLLTGAPVALAAPSKSNNPQIVSNYPDGLHAIPTDPVTWREGADVVMMRGNSGQIQQWYTDPTGFVIHSVWNISKDGTCADGWVRIPNAYPGWGTHLTPGATYCVHNNATHGFDL